MFLGTGPWRTPGVYPEMMKAPMKHCGGIVLRDSQILGAAADLGTYCSKDERRDLQYVTFQTGALDPKSQILNSRH